MAAVVAGVAGALLAQTTETVSLEVLSFQRSAELLVMLVLGGAGRLYGGLVGALIFMVARDRFSGINPQYWYFWIGPPGHRRDGAAERHPRRPSRGSRPAAGGLTPPAWPPRGSTRASARLSSQASGDASARGAVRPDRAERAGKTTLIN
jgi:hypothetical protein